MALFTGRRNGVATDGRGDRSRDRDELHAPNIARDETNQPASIRRRHGVAEIEIRRSVCHADPLSEINVRSRFMKIIINEARSVAGHRCRFGMLSIAARARSGPA
ncbi:MAG: hypothetical protein M5U07_19610 [Xanthobacteraceae bacterium]|nr:hypothetical protein [Xanthobacteraceae bacterium]